MNPSARALTSSPLWKGRGQTGGRESAEVGWSLGSSSSSVGMGDKALVSSWGARSMKWYFEGGNFREFRAEEECSHWETK